MFLVFPLNDKPDWRNPPWFTILLIVVNCVVFFGPQRSDQRDFDRAATFYVDSQLPRIEQPRFIAQLRSTGRSDIADSAQKLHDAKQFAPVLMLMAQDAEFTRRLRKGEIVVPTEPDYALWREQRMHYDTLRGSSFTERWASNPADWRPVTAVTATFLHGSLAHLIGNMVFLFVFGYTVEKTLGRGRFLAFYLLAGIGGEMGDLIARWGSATVGVGASGAISGLMAMYAALYGMRRIRFFFQFLFYFDYVKAPAIILLPAWIAHEFFQQWLDPSGGVAYMAHAGGLISGALLIWLHKRRHPDAAVPVAAEAAADPFERELAQAEAHLKAMRLDAARAAFGALARKRRQDYSILSRYFNLAKLAPASEDIHRAAALIFELDGTDASTEALVHETFTTYLRSAKPSVRFAPRQLVRLALRFARDGHAIDAARLARVLASRAPQHDDLPRVLLAALKALHGKGEREAAEGLGRELREHFPDSAETRSATLLLAG